MRLTPSQRVTLKSAITRFFGPAASVRLFGSRTDDRRRGGDYDVFVECDIDCARTLVERKIACLTHLEQTPEFEGEKIDLVVASRIEDSVLPIHALARREGIRL